MTDVNKVPMFQLSIDTRHIYERLIKAKIGDVVNYQELSSIIGRDIQNGARSNLTSARRIAERDDHYVFDAVKGVGIRRLSDEEMCDLGESVIAHIKKTSRRCVKRMVCVKDFSSLPKEAQTKHNTYVSVFSMLTEMAKPSNIKKIEHRVSEANQTLPFNKTLEAFK